MKKLAILIGLFSLILMGCDDVLSVITVNENGEKVIHNYISMIGDTVYDATVSIKNWQDTELVKEDKFSSADLLFTIVGNKENVVVLGTNESAVEIKFFDGGYKYTAFVSVDSLSNAFGSF